MVPAHFEIYPRLTDRPTNRPTDGQAGLREVSLNFCIHHFVDFLLIDLHCHSLILQSRYCKQTWTNHKLAGVDQWFFWHR